MGSNQQPLKRVWLSWSSGKDCAYTLHQLQQQPDVQVVGLLTTVNERFDRVAMHAVRCQLLRQQAAAVGLPVHEIKLPFPCSNEDYEQRMTAAIAAAKEAGVEAIAYGDLFLEDVRAYREKMMQQTGIATLFPLWLPGSGRTTAETAQAMLAAGFKAIIALSVTLSCIGGDISEWLPGSGRSTAETAQAMLAAGFKAIIACCDPKQLPASFAGRMWDEQLLAELPAGVDPCGENGEFHTFVFDGPVFKQPLDIKVGQTIERDGFVFCDVLPGSYDEALAAAEAAAADQARQQLAQEEEQPPEVDCKEMLKAALEEKQAASTTNT